MWSAPLDFPEAARYFGRTLRPTAGERKKNPTRFTFTAGLVFKPLQSDQAGGKVSKSEETERSYFTVPNSKQHGESAGGRGSSVGSGIAVL